MRCLVATIFPLFFILVVPLPGAGQVGEDLEEVGAWVVQVAVDPMTDEETAFALLVEDSESGSIAFRCAESGFDLMVSPGFVSRDFSVRWRLGDDEPSDWVSSWGRSTNNRTAFARSNDRDLLLSGVMEVNRLAIQVRDRSGMTTLSFTDLDPADTREALAHLNCADGT